MHGTRSISGLTQPRGHRATSPLDERKLAIGRFVQRRLADNVTLIKFAIVGGVGYVVYQVLLFATYDWSLLQFLPEKHMRARIIFFDHGDVRLLISTLVVAEVAILAVFTGHTLWTFRGRTMVDKPLFVRFGQFHANQVMSFGIGIVIINILIVQVGFYHFAALPVAAAAASAWNLLWATHVIWRRAGPGQSVS